VVKQRGALDEGHGFFTGVDEPGIDCVFGGRGAHAENAVFRMEDDLAALGHVVGDLGRDADAQVYEPAFGDVLRAAFGDLAAGKGGAGVGHVLASTGNCTMRST